MVSPALYGFWLIASPRKHQETQTEGFDYPRSIIFNAALTIISLTTAAMGLDALTPYEHWSFTPWLALAFFGVMTTMTFVFRRQGIRWWVLATTVSLALMYLFVASALWYDGAHLHVQDLLNGRIAATDSDLRAAVNAETTASIVAHLMMIVGAIGFGLLLSPIVSIVPAFLKYRDKRREEAEARTEQLRQQRELEREQYGMARQRLGHELALMEMLNRYGAPFVCGMGYEPVAHTTHEFVPSANTTPGPNGSHPNGPKQWGADAAGRSHVDCAQPASADSTGQPAAHDQLRNLTP
jgi:hypothetical protein